MRSLLVEGSIGGRLELKWWEGGNKQSIGGRVGFTIIGVSIELVGALARALSWIVIRLVALMMGPLVLALHCISGIHASGARIIGVKLVLE